MLLAEEATGDGDRLAASRVSVMGTMVRLERDTPAFTDARERYLAAHPSATSVDYVDFECWLMRVEAVRYIGGFGRMGWVDALRDCARALAGIPDAVDARVVALDRYGMDLHVSDAAGNHDARVAFDAGVDDPDALRRATVVLTHRARALLTGGGGR